MESDDIMPNVPRKRSRSPSASTIIDQPSLNIQESTQGVQASSERPPKRLKREPPTYDMSEHVRGTVGIVTGHNALSRSLLKREAKRARKAARRANGPAGKGASGGMEVDDEGQLGDGVLPFTFMAGVDGVVA